MTKLTPFEIALQKKNKEINVFINYEDTFGVSDCSIGDVKIEENIAEIDGYWCKLTPTGRVKKNSWRKINH